VSAACQPARAGPGATWSWPSKAATGRAGTSGACTSAGLLSLRGSKRSLQGIPEKLHEGESRKSSVIHP